uniref:Ig-like domain-containing protein n=1 Tax=Mus spicilegus TaxID=10103 RepID=A0A8C6GM61_MUSSI
MHSLLGLLMVSLWLKLTSEFGFSNPWALSVHEGESVTVNCSYKTSIIALQWYRQKSGEGPAQLILIRSNEREKHSGGLRATLDTSSQSSSLSITAAQCEDTAMYFCATDAQPHVQL